MPSLQLFRVGIANLMELAACGRINFDAADATPGAPGPRWIHSMGPAIGGTLVAGNRGDVVVATGFTAALVTDDASFTGSAAVSSTAVVRYDGGGSLQWSLVLAATAVCDARGLAMQGDAALVTGLTRGAGSAALGPCGGTATGPDQEPFEIEIDTSGQPSLIAQWPSTAANAQGWKTTAYADGSLAM